MLCFSSAWKNSFQFVFLIPSDRNINTYAYDHKTKLEKAIYVFILLLLFELSTCTYDIDLLVFDLAAMTHDNFNPVIVLINGINIFTIQLDHNSIICIVIIQKWLTSNHVIFQQYISFNVDIVQNRFSYTLVHGQLAINTILLIMIVIVCQFCVTPCVLMYGVEKSTSYPYFNLHPITVQTTCNQIKWTSNDLPTRVKKGSNKNKSII